MGELLGTGITHYPPLSYSDETMALGVTWALGDPDLPAELRHPASWSRQMREQWGDDKGATAAVRHRQELVDGFRKVRQAIDDFAPDAVVIVGDDQYENFREDVIPPFTLLAYEDVVAHPWQHADPSSGKMKPNVWGEPVDQEFLIRGARHIAKDLVAGLMERHVDMAYAYEPLHHKDGLPHAFMNSLLYLDYDRQGFDVPVIGMPVNCYGRGVICRRGGLSRLGDPAPNDPPSPSPARAMRVGAALAETVLASDHRIALVASSSWSHAFMCDKTYRMFPDTPADRALYESLVSGDYDYWRGRSLSDIEESGQQELLNWFVLAGAMEAAETKLEWSTFIEVHVFNSNKVFTTYQAAGS